MKGSLTLLTQHFPCTIICIFTGNEITHRGLQSVCWAFLRHRRVWVLKEWVACPFDGHQPTFWQVCEKKTWTDYSWSKPGAEIKKWIEAQQWGLFSHDRSTFNSFFIGFKNCHLTFNSHTIFNLTFLHVSVMSLFWRVGVKVLKTNKQTNKQKKEWATNTSPPSWRKLRINRNSTWEHFHQNL